MASSKFYFIQTLGYFAQARNHFIHSLDDFIALIFTYKNESKLHKTNCDISLVDSYHQSVQCQMWFKSYSITFELLLCVMTGRVMGFRRRGS